MEKLKLAFQVFTAVLALPLLAVMELSHNKKILPIENTGITQRQTQNTGSFYIEDTNRINTVYLKKVSSRRYCK